MIPRDEPPRQRARFVGSCVTTSHISTVPHLEGISKFFGPVRAVIPVVAGMYHMKQLPFQIANITSAFLWSAGVIAPGYFGMQWVQQMLK